MSRPPTILYFLFPVLSLLCLSFPASVRSVEFSTMSARVQKEESPLMLNIIKDSRDSRVGLDYSIRWDFSDLAHLRPSLKTLADGIALVRNWDITENTRVRYYGFATNPWRIFIAREKASVGGAAAAAGPGGGPPVTEAGSEQPVYKKRLRLSLSPLVDDFKRNLDDNLRSVLLQNSLKSAGPQWQHVDTQGKKAFIKDVISLDIWGAPGLDTTKKGLQYISK